MPTQPQTSAREPLTLVEEIVRDVVGPVRAELHLDLGDLPYRVFKVVRSWSGGEPGRGEPTVTRTELGCGKTDTGQVGPAAVTIGGSFSSSLRGLVPEGTILVEELDGTYTDADLVDFGRLVPGDEAFYEVQQDDRSGTAPDRPVLRCRLASHPVRGPSGIDWTMRLAVQEPSAPFGNAQLAEDGGTP